MNEEAIRSKITNYLVDWLSIDEWYYIERNESLFDLFVTETVKRGKKAVEIIFDDISSMPPSFENKLLLNEDILKYYFDLALDKDPGYFVFLSTNDFKLLTPEQSKVLDDVRKKLSVNYRDKIFEFLSAEADIGIDCRTRDKEIIDYIVKNKLYHRVYMIVDDKPSEEIIEFLIDSIKSNPKLLVKYDWKYNPIYNKVKNKEDFIFFMVTTTSIPLDLDDEQIEIIKKSPVLMHTIKDFLVAQKYVPTRLMWLLDKIPELGLFALRKELGEYNLLFYLINYSEDLKDYCDQFPDEMKEIVASYFDNHVDKKSLVLEQALCQDCDFIFNTGFLLLSSGEMTRFIYKNIRKNDILGLIVPLLDEHGINSLPSFNIADNTRYLQNVDIINRFINGLTRADLAHISQLGNLFDIKDFQRQIINNWLVQKLVDLKEKHSFNEEILKMDLKKELLDQIFSNENPLGMSLMQFIKYQDFNNITRSREELAEIVDPLSTKELINVIDSGNQFALDTANIMIDNDNIILKAGDIKSLLKYLDKELPQKDIKVLRKFILRNKDVPATEFVGISDREILKKIHFDCSDYWYKTAYRYFDLYHTSTTYNEEFVKAINGRVRQGKPVNLILAVSAFPIEKLTKLNYLDKLIFDPNDAYYVANLLKTLYVRNDGNTRQFAKDKILSVVSMDVINRLIKNKDAIYYYELMQVINEKPHIDKKISIAILNLNEKYFSGDEYKFYQYKKAVYKLYHTGCLDIDLESLSSDTNKVFAPIVIDLAGEYLRNGGSFTRETINILLNFGTSNDLDDLFCSIIEAQCSELFFDERVLKLPKSREVLLRAIRNKKLSINLDKSEIVDLLDDEIINILLETNQVYFLQKLKSKFVKNVKSKATINNIFNALKDRLGFEVENLDILYQTAGNDIFDLLSDQKVVYLCSVESEELKKLLELIKPRKLTREIIEGIDYSLRQRIFAVDPSNNSIIYVYSKLMNAIASGTIDDYKKYYANIFKFTLPNDFLDICDRQMKIIEERFSVQGKSEELKYYYPVIEKMKQLYIEHKNQELVEYLIDSVKESNNMYLLILNSICSKYIEHRREIYGKKGNIFTNTNVKYSYEPRSYYDAFLKYLIKNDLNFIQYNILRMDNRIDASIPNLNVRLFRDRQGILDYYSLQKMLGRKLPANIDERLTREINKNIGSIKNKLISYMNTYSENDELKKHQIKFINNPKASARVKKILIVPERNFKFGLELQKVNVKAVINNVISDPKKYDVLLSIMEKYKILDWEDIFKPSIGKLSNESDVGDLYAFINSFNRIYDAEYERLKNLKKEELTPTIEKMQREGTPLETIRFLVDRAVRQYVEDNIYNSMNGYRIVKYVSDISNISACYSLILGAEDYKFVLNDPDPNSSFVKNSERKLNRACDVYLKGFQSRTVSIPSFIKDVKTNNNKTLRVIVGNRTNPWNVTHGERTGSCMRAYGHADNYGNGSPSELFEFCATNPNGFHIVFTDPDTGEYVSRVSGFRNGNTVVLNQLRRSLKRFKYPNSDLVVALRKIGKELIELSKNSDLPIENVICSDCIAMSKEKTTKIYGDSIYGNVYHGYLDVSDNVVVVATTGIDNEPVPVMSVSEKHPFYECVRTMPKEFDSLHITTRELINMQRIVAIKDCLAHSDDKEYYKNLDFDYSELSKKYNYVIIGDDWFVALDENLNVLYNMIQLDPRAKDELQSALEKIERIKAEIIKEGEYRDGKNI